ncbi:phage major tail protein, TP901-1 family [Seinonella peptonophila]|uniref:Phage major tail protein, TP901-1 family n=1 Tax=Seinonella peptonophila TaxID=112248 RepID=A0A1M4VB51_9BACL|nr:phage tail protein [Seinonella peptonophila]SHE66194.1 phage major tail protein, TP901-1 family [Seinonella peptonophila]
MPKVAGVDVLLYLNTGTDVSPTYTVLGGQTEATLNREAEEIDVSAKTDPDDYGDFLIGKKTWNIECEGFYVDSDTAFDALEQAFENREHLMVELRMPSGKTYSGTVRIQELPMEFPQDDGTTFSTTLLGSGPLTITP